MRAWKDPAAEITAKEQGDRTVKGGWQEEVARAVTETAARESQEATSKSQVGFLVS